MLKRIAARARALPYMVRATRARVQNVTAPEANHGTEVNNQNVVAEMQVLVLRPVLQFVRDRGDFESRVIRCCLT
jgi:hypothetical protein